MLLEKRAKVCIQSKGVLRRVALQFLLLLERDRSISLWSRCGWTPANSNRHPSEEGCLLIPSYSGLGESGGGGVGGKGQKSHATAYIAQDGNTKPSIRLAVANTSVGYRFIASAPKWVVQKANKR